MSWREHLQSSLPRLLPSGRLIRQGISGQSEILCLLTMLISPGWSTRGYGPALSALGGCYWCSPENEASSCDSVSFECMFINDAPYVCRVPGCDCGIGTDYQLHMSCLSFPSDNHFCMVLKFQYFITSTWRSIEGCLYLLIEEPIQLSQ